MSRYLRYLLIWLSCTAVSVTAVILTVRFVVGETRPTPLVARSAPTVFTSSTARPPKPTRTAEPSPTRVSPRPTRTTPPPDPTRSSPSPDKPSPSRSTPDSTPSPGQGTGDFTDCGEGGSGVHTIQSAGGQASVRFGEEGVCLVSAVPTRGFTVSTSQTESDTLSVTFSGDRQESLITATTEPEAQAVVRETSW